MNKKPSKHRTALQWEKAIAEQATSGQTIKQFCAERGLAISNFYGWRKKINTRENIPESTDSSSPPLFVELEPKTNHVESFDHWDIELQIGNNVLLRVRQ